MDGAAAMGILGQQYWKINLSHMHALPRSHLGDASPKGAVHFRCLADADMAASDRRGQPSRSCGGAPAARAARLQDPDAAACFQK